MDDPVGDALITRRIPHSRQGKGKPSKGGRSSRPFDPLRALGRYKLHVGPGKPQAESGRAGDAASWLEIHELTPGEDGLVATFNIQDKLSGMLVLAGSRKGLAGIIEEFETSPTSGDEEQSSAGEGSAGSTADEDGSPELQQSSLEAEDERINRRAQAFEKNSFRNPKFWLRWQGRVIDPEDRDGKAEQPLETNTGYVVFSSNDCERFEGTISCAKLNWINVKLQGWKIHSRSMPCPLAWETSE